MKLSKLFLVGSFVTVLPSFVLCPTIVTNGNITNHVSTNSDTSLRADTEITFNNWTFVDGSDSNIFTPHDARLIPQNVASIKQPILLEGDLTNGFYISNEGWIYGSRFCDQPYILDFRNLTGIDKSKILGLKLWTGSGSVPRLFALDTYIREVIFDDEYINFHEFITPFGSDENGSSSMSNIRRVVLPNSVSALDTSFEYTNQTLEYFNFPNNLMENPTTYIPPLNMFNGCTNSNLRIDVGHYNDTNNLFDFDPNRLGNLGDLRNVFYFSSYQQWLYLQEQITLGSFPGWASYQDYCHFDGTPPILPTSVNITGQTQLQITSGETGYIQYIANVFPAEAIQSVTWTLQNAPNGISVNSSGELHYDGSTQKGQYTFKIIASSAADVNIKDEKEVSLTVDDVVGNITINIIGDSNLNGIQGQSGQSQYIANVLPDNVPQTVTWSLENVVNPNLTISTNTGLLSWTNLNANIYNFNVKATSTYDNSVSSRINVTLTITLPTPNSITINGSETINATSQIAGSSIYTAIVNPTDASQSVNWSLENAPSGVNIDQSGVLMWNDQLLVNTYNFSIIVTSTANINITSSKNIVLIVSYAPITQFSIIGKSTIDASVKKNGSESYQVKTNIGASQSVTWSLENAPSEVNIDQNGLLTWDGSLEINEYTFLIKAVSNFDATKVAEKTVNLNIRELPQMAWYYWLFIPFGIFIISMIVLIIVKVCKNAKDSGDY